MNDERLYFAYGSNINLNQMAFRCPAATPICPVTLEDYELTFRGGGVATVVPAEGKQVPGLLWELTPECECALDHYEGYPRLYDKEQVTVTDKNGMEFDVMVYVMTPQFSREVTVPSEYYYKGIMDGYRQNGMDTAPLKKAYNKAKREMYAEQMDFLPWERAYPWEKEKPATQKAKKPHKGGRHER